MEDNLIFFENGKRPQFFLDGRLPQKNNLEWKTINLFNTEESLNFLKLEDDLNFFKWRTTSHF